MLEQWSAKPINKLMSPMYSLRTSEAITLNLIDVSILRTHTQT